MKNKFGKKIGKISFSFNLHGTLKKAKKQSFFGKENLTLIDSANAEGSFFKKSNYREEEQN